MGMKPFQNYLDSVGYTLAKMAIPEKEIVYVCYDKLSKKLVKVTESPHIDSHLKFLEKEYINQKEYDAAMRQAEHLYKKAIEKWHDDLRGEYSDLTLPVYNVLYSKAYEDGHHAGFDEVASKMSDLSQFAEDIIKAWKEQN